MYLLGILFLFWNWNNSSTSVVHKPRLECLEYKDSLTVYICPECPATYQLQREYLNDSVFIEKDNRNIKTPIATYDEQARIDTFKITNSGKNWYKLYNGNFYSYFSEDGFALGQKNEFYDRNDFTTFSILTPYQIIEEDRSKIYVMKLHQSNQAIRKINEQDFLAYYHFNPKMGITKIRQIHRHAKTYILVKYSKESCN